MSARPRAEFPEKLQFLFEPSRYKVAYGGRGGAKSWGFARALLIIGANQTKRIVCAREFQKSIADSVHQLLKNQIDALDLNGFYSVRETYIEGKNGTEFSFHGLKHNVQNIKSLEGADICWVEEAEAVSKASWETLIPTIRKDGSEIWVSFNPDMPTDETYKRFVPKPPTGAKVVPIGWRDNPWFPAVLKQEREDLKERDPDEYDVVWEGNTRQTVAGAIYANEMRTAQTAGRICSVPYDASKPVQTFWDLGRADMTTIWFAQVVGFEYRIIDYYENRGHVLAHYLKVLGEKPYHYGEDWLPHDADNELLASELTITQQMRAAGRKCRIVPKLPVAEGINAARTVFGKCWFDADRCSDGLNALRHYCYEVDPDTREYSARPLHNWASHGADAWRYLALALQPSVTKPKELPKREKKWVI